jgi:hypothetical protein
MPFQWSVEPYRWLYELREEYTRSVTLASRSKAYEYAEKAEAWMKQNAPWKDRTLGERMRKGVDYLPGARAGLRVRVDNKQEESEYKTGMAAAIKEDKRQLKILNATSQRQRDILASYDKERLTQGLITQGQYQANIAKYDRTFARRDALPKNKSAVVAFEKATRSNRLPVVYLKFSHHPRVTYAVWLEIAKGGRYAIVGPATEYWGQKFLNEINSLVQLKQYRDRIVLGEIQTAKESSAERFAAHSERMTAKHGSYTPWSDDLKAERKRRRKYYDPDTARKQRQRRLDEQVTQDIENIQRAGKLYDPEDTGTRKYVEPKHTGSTYNPMTGTKRR